MIEIFNHIKSIYGRDIFTLKELTDILINCDFSRAEARQIIRDSLNTKQLGKISFRKIRRKMPDKKSFIAIMKSCK